jgi:hypothetical protein
MQRATSGVFDRLGCSGRPQQWWRRFEEPSGAWFASGKWRLVGELPCMIAVQNGGTNLQEEMCAAPKPPHLLLLDHASGNELIGW